VISDVNMCYSEFARKYLADTGLPKERTYQTGSPMAEVLHMNLEKIQKSDVLERLGLEKDKYILLSAQDNICVSIICNTYNHEKYIAHPESFLRIWFCLRCLFIIR
jgi:hypothetical protein